MYTINLFTDFGVRILYIKEINNSIVLSKKLDSKDGKYVISKTDLLDIIKNNSEENYEKYLRIINNREKLIIGEKAINQSQVYTLCMHPSVKCNLNCEYCFASKTKELPDKAIDISIAKRAIDYLLYEFGKDGQRYNIDISGSGEPLLNFEMIKEIEEYCEDKRNEIGKEIKIKFPTNATLLDQQKADYFISKPNILLGVSIDGNCRQSSNRKFKDGRYAFEQIEHGINLVKDRNVGFAVTITDKNEDVDILFDYLYKKYKNVDAISMQLVRDFDYESPTSFYRINIDNLLNHYRLLVDKLIQHIQEKDYNYLFVLLRGVDTFGTYILRAIQKGSLTTTRCGAGKDRISVDSKGNIYTCPVLTGNQSFYIGNIYAGIDVNKQQKYLKKNTEIVLECKNCWAAYICGGECAATAYICNDDLYKPNKKICAFRRGLIKISIAFVELLKLQYPLEYNIIKKYTYTKPLFTDITDSGLWVINKYLKMKEKFVTSTEVLKNVKRCDEGTKPNCLQEYIQKYEEGFEAYEINNINDYYKLNYPVIAYGNNEKSIFYQYYIIHGIKDDILKVEMMNNKNINIPSLLFNSQISSIVMQKKV